MLLIKVFALDIVGTLLAFPIYEVNLDVLKHYVPQLFFCLVKLIEET